MANDVLAKIGPNGVEPQVDAMAPDALAQVTGPADSPLSFSLPAIDRANLGQEVGQGLVRAQAGLIAALAMSHMVRAGVAGSDEAASVAGSIGRLEARLDPTLREAAKAA